MKGLELSEHYYKEIVAPMLDREFPLLVRHLAAGLVGEGSECFGFDDVLSRDHDWGPAVCLWLEAKIIDTHGGSIRDAMEALPKEYCGFPARTSTQWSEGRTGVLEIEHFYTRLIGSARVPKSPRDWLVIPEAALACATNGKVFCDHAGIFSLVREGLLGFYPEDVRLKKIAAACAKLAQAGQYNYPRCIVRKELVAADQALAEFVSAVCSVVFLLNKRYKPFYKWMHRALQELPVLGEATHRSLGLLVSTSLDNTKAERIEELCALIAQALLNRGISDATGDFMMDHAVSVQEKIQDSYVKGLHIMVG